MLWAGCWNVCLRPEFIPGGSRCGRRFCRVGKGHEVAISVQVLRAAVPQRTVAASLFWLLATLLCLTCPVPWSSTCSDFCGLSSRWSLEARGVVIAMARLTPFEVGQIKAHLYHDMTPLTKEL